MYISCAFNLENENILYLKKGIIEEVYVCVCVFKDQYFILLLLLVL